MKKVKMIYKIKRHICCFYDDNKMLTSLSLIAIAFILFYYFSYDMPEMWKNAGVLVDILFQLSLAIIANLIFFIFQVYIPNFKNSIRIRPIISNKMMQISQNMNEPFLEITAKYLNKNINLDELSDDNIKIITEKYRPNDISPVQVAYECRNLTFDQYFKMCLEKNNTIIQELLLTYEPYLNSKERDLLLLIKENNFNKIINNPLLSLFDTKGLHGNAVHDVFKHYQNIYKDIQKLIQNSVSYYLLK